MRARILQLLGALLLGGLVLLLGLAGQWMPATLLAISLFLLLMALGIERRKLSAQELVAWSLMAAIAAASRFPFAAIPSLQPVSFLVMATSSAFGRRAGFFVGALAAFLSNMALGQGPWTPWQMVAWALCGLATPRRGGRILLSLYGFLVGFLFGWFMNSWIALSSGMDASFGTWISLNIASFPMDLTHGTGTAILIALFWEPVQRILVRTRRRYGLPQGKEDRRFPKK